MVYVAENLIAWLEANFNHPEIVELIKSRDRFGRSKYGDSLRVDDLRDPIKDAEEEIGDMLQYLYKARLQNKDIGGFKIYLPVLERLICGEVDDILCYFRDSGSWGIFRDIPDTDNLVIIRGKKEIESWIEEYGEIYKRIL